MTLDLLRAEMDKLKLTSVQRETLEADVPRARQALAKAVTAGARDPASYAMTVFRSEPATKPPPSTNRAVVVDCKTCGGDRMVVFSTRTDTYNGRSAEVEEMAPCPDCNPNCNTRRPSFHSPDPARVRER